MIDPRAALIILACYGAFAGGRIVVHAIGRLVHRAEAPHCQEFRRTRTADEQATAGAAHFCQFDERDGSIGFTAEACECRR